jgi:hypothetical protein
MLPGLSAYMMTAVGVASGPTLTFEDADSDSDNLTTYTFAGQSIGTAASNRYIIVAVAASDTNDTFSASSVTVGSVSATKIIDLDSGFQYSSIWIAAVPTGTTATVSVTFSEAVGFCSIGIWSVTGLSSATPTDTDSKTSGGGNLSLDVLAGGFAIAVTNAGSDIDWNGTATRRYFHTLHNGADVESETAQTLSIDFEGGNTACAATWR